MTTVASSSVSSLMDEQNEHRILQSTLIKIAIGLVDHQCLTAVQSSQSTNVFPYKWFGHQSAKITIKGLCYIALYSVQNAELHM